MKIYIIGNAASGKSTLAEKLKEKIDELFERAVDTAEIIEVK